MIRTLFYTQVLLRNDLKLVGRDRFLLAIPFYPFMAALAVRFGLPPLMSLLEFQAGFDLTLHLPLVVGFMALILAPALAGMVLGFLLIDERDEGTLAALQVTPLSLSRFYYHRVVMVMLVSTVIEVIAFYLIGAIRLTFPLLLVSALAASPLAAICGLAFARFAENKIQGFGGVKIVSVMMFLPVAASLFGSPWNLLIGVFFPPSWSFSGFVMLASNEAIGLLWLALGMAAQGAIVLVLLRSVKMG